MTPTSVDFPAAGAFRLARYPSRLPAGHDVVGHHRFDDPRPNTQSRFTVRYCARTLRGCLIELLDQFRPDPVARSLEDTVVGVPPEFKDPSGVPALSNYLAKLNVGRVIARRPLTILSIHDVDVQAWLNREPAVRALLDSPEGRAILLPAGASPSNRPHLDGAAVRLSTAFGRDLTRACSLALYDRTPQVSGVHYRSRHDDVEDCWALYDRTPVDVADMGRFSDGAPEHRQALRSVADLWGLSLPSEWG